MELNTSQPQHSQIIGRPSRNPILFAAVIIVILIIAGLGFLVWQQKQQIADAASELTNAQKLNQDLSKVRTDLQSKVTTLEEQSKQVASDTEQITTMAQNYQKAGGVTAYDFKIEKQEGNFARVSFKTPFVEQCFYKKISTTWTQVYCGTSKPSTTIVRQYEIPTAFLSY